MSTEAAGKGPQLDPTLTPVAPATVSQPSAPATPVTHHGHLGTLSVSWPISQNSSADQSAVHVSPKAAEILVPAGFNAMFDEIPDLPDLSAEQINLGPSPAASPESPPEAAPRDLTPARLDAVLDVPDDLDAPPPEPEKHPATALAQDTAEAIKVRQLPPSPAKEQDAQVSQGLESLTLATQYHSAVPQSVLESSTPPASREAALAPHSAQARPEAASPGPGRAVRWETPVAAAASDALVDHDVTGKMRGLLKKAGLKEASQTGNYQAHDHRTFLTHNASVTVLRNGKCEQDTFSNIQQHELNNVLIMVGHTKDRNGAPQQLRIAAQPHVLEAFIEQGLHHAVPGFQNAIVSVITGAMIAHFTASLSAHIEQLKLSETQDKDKSLHIDTKLETVAEPLTPTSGRNKERSPTVARSPTLSTKKTAKNDAREIEKAAIKEDRKKQEERKAEAFRADIKRTKDEHEKNLSEAQRSDIDHTNKMREELK